MDAPALPDDREAELQQLRLRAYGPSADIANDPVALRRLRDLEQAAAARRRDLVGSRERPSDEWPGAATVPVAAGVPAVSLDVESGTAPGGPDAAAGSAEPAWWRRHRVHVVASAVAVAVVAALAAVGASVVGSRPDSSLTATGRTLRDVTGWGWFVSAFSLDATQMREYGQIAGFRVWAGARGDARCLLVAVDDTPTGFACARGREPTADVLVTDGYVDMRATELAEGTTVRFVLRADRVDVWLSPAPERT